jgi:hypothetical protein
MKIFALSTLSFVIYRLLVEKNEDKAKQHYSKPGKRPLFVSFNSHDLEQFDLYTNNNSFSVFFSYSFVY